MFQNWGFLISEMVVLILLAALLGVLVGWIIWGRRQMGDTPQDQRREIAELRSDLQACRAMQADKDARIATLETELETQGRNAVAAASDHISEVVIAAEDVGEKPETLDAPRNGDPDDLKQIKGIGPKLEILCHRLGFFHFDQIANWTEAEVAWVDANLEGFKGRVSRDNWVEQARILSDGGETEFSKRVTGGGVYEA